MPNNDASRLRELTKMMASENDPGRLKVFAEEAENHSCEHRSTGPNGKQREVVVKAISSS
jgi:hypothetical protein